MALVLRKTSIIFARWINPVKTSGFHNTSHDNPFFGFSRELKKRVTLLHCESARAPRGICNVYLVGMCHFSPRSFRDVKDIVSLLKPEIVFMEFDKERVESLLAPEESKPQGMSSFIDMVKSLWRNEYHLYGVLSSLAFTKFRKELGEFRGSEIRTAYENAYEEAIKYGGKVVFGDRASQTARAKQTRASPKMSISEKRKSILEPLIFYCLPSSTFKQSISWYADLTEDEILNEKCINRKFIDSEHEAIVNERDRCMCAELLKVASESRSVVAVVDGDHLPGIPRIWKKVVGLEMESTVFDVIH